MLRICSEFFWVYRFWIRLGDPTVLNNPVKVFIVNSLCLAAVARLKHWSLRHGRNCVARTRDCNLGEGDPSASSGRAAGLERESHGGGAPKEAFRWKGTHGPRDPVYKNLFVGLVQKAKRTRFVPQKGKWRKPGQTNTRTRFVPFLDWFP